MEPDNWFQFDTQREDCGWIPIPKASSKFGQRRLDSGRLDHVDAFLDAPVHNLASTASTNSRDWVTARPALAFLVEVTARSAVLCKSQGSISGRRKSVPNCLSRVARGACLTQGGSGGEGQAISRGGVRRPNELVADLTAERLHGDRLVGFRERIAVDT
jgi:hypothetical protein